MAQATENGKHQPISRKPAGPLRGPAQHADLVPQGEELDVACRTVPAPDEHKVGEQAGELVKGVAGPFTLTDPLGDR